MGRNKNHTTSWDKKFTQPLGIKKIPQPLRQKNHTTSCQESWDKKIKHPLDKKNHATSLNKKNHTTCQDKKKTEPLSQKKATSRVKKFTQPLGKIYSHNLSRQKNHALNRSNCV